MLQPCWCVICKCFHSPSAQLQENRLLQGSYIGTHASYFCTNVNLQQLLKYANIWAAWGRNVEGKASLIGICVLLLSWVRGIHIANPQLGGLTCTELSLIKKCLIATQQVLRKLKGMACTWLGCKCVCVQRRRDDSKENEKCALTVSSLVAGVGSCLVLICFILLNLISPIVTYNTNPFIAQHFLPDAWRLF